MKITKALVLLLCFALLFGVYALPAALATDSLTSTYDYDYSREGYYFNTTITASDIIEALGYGEVSPGERAFLDEYGDLNVKYETVTNQQLSISTLDGDTIVTALVYSYTTANGETVVWTPESAEIKGVIFDFEPSIDGAVYTANLGEVALGDDPTVSVKYEMNEITISADDVNRVLNLAYTSAVDLKTEIALYTSNAPAIAEYRSALAAYEEYRKNKMIYDEKKAKYDTYVAAYALFEQNTIRYNEYLAQLEAYMYYEEYPELLAKYNADKAKYDTYVSNLALIDVQLETLHNGLMGTSTYLNRQLYGCFFADLVDEVVAQKDKLTKIGASKEDINKCEAASNNIREILKPTGGTPYTELKTTEEKYSFYVNNYEGLRDNIITLAVSFYSIYTVPTVKPTMHIASSVYGREDYTERFAIFIAQLIYFANALSDEPIMCDGEVLDGNVELSYRRLSDGKDFDDVKISTLLADPDGKIFVTDTGNATPVSLVEVKEPTVPAEPTVTVKPDTVARPDRPAAVQNPGLAPAVVAEPVRPSFVPEDLNRLNIVDNGIYLALVEALDNGSLVSGREERSEAFVYTPTVVLEKKINATDIVEVTFCDANGNIITTIGVDKYSAVNFTGALPTKPDDLTSTYKFSSLWVTADGDNYDLSSVTDSVTLYPSFIEIPKTYSVKNNLIEVPLGSFDFDDIPVEYFVDMASKQGSGLRFIADGITVDIPFSSVVDFAGVAHVAVSYERKSDYDYTCEVTVYDSSFTKLEIDTDVSILIPCDDATFGNGCKITYSDSSGELNYAKKNYRSGSIGFDVKVNTPHQIFLKYKIDTTSGLKGKLVVPEDAFPGVTIELDIPAGIKAQLYYLQDGVKYTIENNSFVMPYGDITVGGNLEVIVYTVKFVSDGKVISEKLYTYGETVVVPNQPTKINDDKYSYTFIGWSPNVSMTVTGDVTYEAQFEATPLPEVEEKISWFDVVFYTGVAIVGICLLLLLRFIIRKTKLISRLKRLFKWVISLFKKNGADADDLTDSADNSDLETRAEEPDESTDEDQ